MSIKLSNLQISALAHKIKEEIAAPIKEHNEKIVNSEEYKNFFETNEDCIAFKALSDKYDFNYPGSDISKIRSFYFKPLLIAEKHIRQEDIEREIILATIDTADIDSLVAKVSEKFK